MESTIKRPTKIDCGRPGGEQGGVGVVQSGVGGVYLKREPESVGGGGADERGASHEHGTDGVSDVIQRGELHG